MDIIKLLTSLYRNSTVKVVVNGHLTEEVSCQQGIKQRCVHSVLLFILYMAEVGSFLENNQSGIKLQGVHISALLYVDDLILIGRTPDEAKILLLYFRKSLKSWVWPLTVQRVIFCTAETPI